MLRQCWCALLLAVISLVAGDALADGCFVWNKAADLNEPSQKAIIYWEKGREVLVLQVRYEGPADDFAWIVPLPAKPDVQAIAPADDPFAEISVYTQRRHQGKSRSDVDGPDGPREKVTVLERKVVGVYDVAVLSASDPAALSQWLNTHGFVFPEKRADVLKHYTQKNWVYVAMRIDRKALGTDEARKLKAGELQPIRFTFPSERMVYPLRISSVNGGQTEVLLYLLAGTPMVLAEPRGLASFFSIEENISPQFLSGSDRDPTYGTYPPVAGEHLPVTWNALCLPEETTLFLSKYRLTCRPDEMMDDLLFAPFVPQPYWESRLAEMDWCHKVATLEVLAWHDEKRFGPRLTELLEEGARSRQVSLRSQVAGHPRVTPRIWEILVTDEDSLIRSFIASNPHVPIDVLRKMADTMDNVVRSGLARNPVADAGILRRLAEDTDEAVVWSVAEHPAVPVEVLRELARSDVRWRRVRAAGSLRCPGDLLMVLAKDREIEVRHAVACNRETPPALLAQLAADAAERVRAEVAYNPMTPKHALESLLQDKAVDVRVMLAQNGSTPVAVLRRLVGDPEASIQKLARNALSQAEAVPDRVIYYYWSGTGPGGAIMHTSLHTFELDVTKQRLRLLQKTAHAPEPMLPHQEARILTLLGREPWQSPGDEQFGKIAAVLKAWLLTRPPADYNEPMALGNEDGCTQSITLSYAGLNRRISFHHRGGFRQDDPLLPPTELRAFLDAVWGQRQLREVRGTTPAVTPGVVQPGKAENP